LIGVLGTRGVLKWTLVPGLAAAVAFAFLVPAPKRADGHHAPSFASSLGQMPKTYWHFSQEFSRTAWAISRPRC